MSAPIVAAGMTRRDVMLTFGGLLLVMLLASLDQAIVATALPTIAGDFGHLQDLSWVVTVYLLATTASTPLWGSLGDSYGRKRLLTAAVLVFVGGSVLCGISWNIVTLVLFRGIQGIGAGGLMVMAMSVVADIIAPRQRGKYQGYIQAVFAVATVAGPLLGGLFVDSLSWRWVFWINIPLGAIALIAVTSTLKTPAVRRAHTLDYPGAALLVTAVTAVLLVAEWGGRSYAWTSAPVVLLSVAAVAATVGFVLRERSAPEPILPPAVLGDRVVVVVATVLFLVSACFFAANVYLPTYLQVVREHSATASGLMLLPMLLTILLATTVSGRLVSKYGRYKVFPVCGTVLVAIAMGIFARLDVDTAPWLVVTGMVTMGLGFGCITQILVVAVQNAVDQRRIGVATASTNFFRSLGGALGLALFGAILTARSTGAAAGSDLGSPQAVRNLGPAAARAVGVGFAHALHGVFYTGTAIAVVAAVVVWLLPELPLRSKGPNAAGGSGAAPNARQPQPAGAPPR